MALIAAVSFGAAGCGDKHTHDYEWEVTTAPTCTTEGVETGTCPKDNDKTTRPVSVDPNAHVYGEWVVKEPTFTEEGLAVKTCTQNAEHAKVEVTLPVLGSSEYTVNVTTQPTLTAEGEATYKLANAAGEISFTAPVAAKGYANVGEALEGALAAKSLVGKTEQKNSNGTYTVLSECGDKYLRINDLDGSRELFFDFDEEGNLTHAVEKNSWGDFSVIDINGEYLYSNPLDYVQGYRYYLSYALPADGAYAVFGTENLLSILYEFATDDADTALVNGDYAETMKVENGKVVGSFSYGRFAQTERSKYNDTYSEVIGYDMTDLFYETVVTFMLDENSMLETLDIATNVYSFAYSTKTDKVTPFEDGATIEKPITADENGVYSVDKSKFSESDVLARTVSIKQTALSAIEELPENPIDFEAVTVTSFELYNGSTKIENGSTVTTTTKNALFLSVQNILPNSANEYLGLNGTGVYMKDGTTETAIDYSTAIRRSNNVKQVM
ncbi:MAG: hypothetical protein K2H43_01990, partial [Clostridia bacterium]|nr:hypothetical protein [Clostridia bacterium]